MAGEKASFHDKSSGVWVSGKWWGKNPPVPPPPLPSPETLRNSPPPSHALDEWSVISSHRPSRALYLRNKRFFIDHQARNERLVFVMLLRTQNASHQGL